MSDIYYGRVEHPWAVNIDSWAEETPEERARLQQYEASINQHVASFN